MDTADLRKSVEQHTSVLKAAAAVPLALWTASSLVLFSITKDLSNSSVEVGAVNDQLYDGSGEQARDVWAAGVVSNTTPRDNTWFNLRYRDQEMNKSPGVSEYQKALEDTFYSMLAHSNFYEFAQEFTQEACWACTAAGFMQPDPVEKNVTFTLLKTGSYWIAEDARGRVNVLCREYWMAGNEILKQWKDLPEDRKETLKNHPYDKHLIRQMVRPRDSWDSEDKGNLNFPFESTYWLVDSDLLLEESGYESFPFLVWRVERQPGSAWGTGPGMKFIRDGQIQQVVSETMILADQKLVDPPMETVDAMRDFGLMTHPGAINYIPRSEIGVTKPINQGIGRPIGADREDRLRDAVNRHFKLNFFLMQSQAEKTMTRAEFLGRQSEQVASLAPIFGRFTSEVVDQMWDQLIKYATEFDILPTPSTPLPEGLDSELDVEYQSPMTTLQKRAHGLAGVEAFVGQIQQLNIALANAPPQVFDALSAQKTVDLMAESNGVQTLLTDDKERKKASELRQQAAQMQAQQQAQLQAVAAMGGKAPV